MPDDLLGCLKTILGSRAHADAPTASGELRLRERKANMTTKVVGLSPRTTSFRLEKVGHLGALAQDTGLDIKKVCDYAIIEDLGTECETTLVEMKKTLRDSQDAFEQLRRSKPIVDYLLSVCSVELERTWEHTIKYVLVAEKEMERLAKRRTRDLSHEERHRDIQVTVSVGTHLHL